MDKMNFIKDGENKLPPGFRFEPTDEEIVFQYLARKTFSHPLPALVIPELFNIFSFDPWELPGNLDQDKYFFSYDTGSQTGKATCSGYWKASGSTKRIICSKNMPIVGIRKSLIFYEGEKNNRAFSTDWIMHEYCLALLESSGSNVDVRQKKNSQGSLVRIGNWTLCRIFSKKMSTGIKEVEEEDDEDNDNHNYNKGRDFCGFLSDTDSSSASSSSPNSDSSIFSEVTSSSIGNGDQDMIM